MHKVYFTGEFVPVERFVRKLDGLVDVWLRRNPREDSDGVKMADELTLTFPMDSAPTLEELAANIDVYFIKDATPEITNEDIMAAVNLLASLIVGGERHG